MVDEICFLNHARMGYLLHAPYVHVDQDLLTTFMERRSESTNTFHFPMGEITIIPKDVHRIL